MTPCRFPQCNARYGPPNGTAESQVMTIPAYQGRVAGGSMDGAYMVVVAWEPDPQELKDLAAGKPIFLGCLGGLPPHILGTSFEQVTNPA